MSCLVWLLDFGVYKLCAGIVDCARRIAPVQAPSLAHHLSIGKHRCFRTFHFFALLQSWVLLFPRCYSDAQVVLFRGRGIQYFQNAFNMVAEVKVASSHGYLWWGGLAHATSGHF